MARDRSSLRAGSFGRGGGERENKAGKKVGGERENEPARKPLYSEINPEPISANRKKKACLVMLAVCLFSFRDEAKILHVAKCKKRNQPLQNFISLKKTVNEYCRFCKKSLYVFYGE